VAAPLLPLVLLLAVLAASSAVAFFFFFFCKRQGPNACNMKRCSDLCVTKKRAAPRPADVRAHLFLLLCGTVTAANVVLAGCLLVLSALLIMLIIPSSSRAWLGCLLLRHRGGVTGTSAARHTAVAPLLHPIHPVRPAASNNAVLLTQLHTVTWQSCTQSSLLLFCCQGR
jgi:hypothetical protein